MHNDWEELIPFYVAGSLPRAETVHLESHLARCERCRASVEEWRAIASVVRADAAAQLRDLPPLSRRVVQTAARSADSRRAALVGSADLTAPLPRRAQAAGAAARPLSVTLVAAVLTIVIFGGLLALLVLRGSLLLPQPAAESVALLPTATTAFTPDASPSPAAVAVTASLAPQIIVIEPSVTPLAPTGAPPTTAPIVIPTQAPLIFSTPLPPTMTRPPLLVTSQPPPTLALPTVTLDPAAETFSLQMAAPAYKAACTLHAAAAGASLYAGPGLQYGVVGTFTAADALPALALSDTGWFQAQYLDGSLGWVASDQVYTSGSCDSLAVIASAPPTELPPTATIYAGVPVVVVSADSVNLRSGPGMSYPVVALALASERLPVMAQASSADGIWYLVTRAGQGAVWVSAGVVQLVPADALIPPAATIPPTPAPTATVIPFMATWTPSPTTTPVASPTNQEAVP